MGFLDDLTGDQPVDPTKINQDSSGGFMDWLSGDNNPTPQDVAGTPQENAARQPHNLLTQGLDLLGRLSYGSMKFQDVLADRGMGAIGDAINAGAQEVVNPTERLTGEDLLDRYVPEFGKHLPITKKVAGFIYTALTDPLGWLSAGTGDGAEVGLSTGKAVLNIAGTVERNAEIDRLIASGAKDLLTEQFSGMSAAERGLKQVATSVDEELSKRANQHIADMIDTLGRTDLVDKGGLKVFGQTIPGTPEVAKFIAKTSGLGKLSDYVKSMWGVNRAAWLGRELGGEKGVALDELVRTFDNYNDRLSEMAGQPVMNVLAEKGQAATKDALDRVGRLGAEIDQVTMDRAKAIKDGAYQAASLEPPETLAPVTRISDDEASKIEEQVINNWKQTNGLSQAEEDIYRAFKQYRQGIANQAQDAGLLQDVLQNHQGRYYKDDPADILLARSWKEAGLPEAMLPGNMLRTLEDTNSALAAGKQPIYDAAQIAALQTGDLLRTKALKDFKDAAQTILGKSLNDPTLPDNVKRLFRFMGDSRFSWFGQSRGSSFRKVVEFLDKGQGMFKKSATVIKPYFAPRQFVQNMAQAYLEQGAKALKSLDPRTIYDMVPLLLHGLPGFEDYANGVKIANSARTYSGEELVQMAQDYGVKKGVVPFVENRMESSAAKNLDLLAGTNPVMRAAKQYLIDQHGAIEGQQKFARLMTMGGAVNRFLNWSGWVEDANRTSFWLNAIRGGQTPKDAASAVNRAFFDYSHSNSEFQQQVLKRAVPFFTFQKNAAFLLGHTLATNPGRIINTDRALNTLASSVAKLLSQAETMRGDGQIKSADKLNSDELNALPGMIFDQPHALTGFAKDMTAHILNFNSFSPLDIAGMWEDDGKGGIDWAKTAKKFFVSQLTPYIKYPLEVLINKNLFTDQMINNPKYPGRKLGDVTPEGVLANIATGVLGSRTNSAWVTALARAVGEPVLETQTALPGVGATGFLDNESLVNVAKKILGWQEITNPQTGAKTVYANPYLMHALTSFFPGLTTAIRVDKQDLTPLERAMDIFAGTSTTAINMKKSGAGKFIEIRSQMQDLKEQINYLKRIGAMDEAEKREKLWRDLVKQMGDLRSGLNLTNVRG